MALLRRRWFLTTLAIVFLLIVAAGTYYVFKVAGTRSGLYAEAVALQKAGDSEGAATRLRSILETKPEDHRARGMLMRILADRNEFDAAEDLVRYWVESDEHRLDGLKEMAQLSLQQAKFDEALRYARLIADRKPGFLHEMIMRIEGFSDSPSGRARALHAAETLASLEEEPLRQAQAWLYAAETARDLENAEGPGSAKSSLASRCQTACAHARESLQETVLWKKRLPEGKALMARADLLSTGFRQQAAAVTTLREFVKARPEAYVERIALVRQFVKQTKPEEATALVASMLEAPQLVFVRAISVLATGQSRDVILDLLKQADTPNRRLVTLMRARILVRGEEGEREEGMRVYEQLALDNPDEAGIVRESFHGIRQAGDLGRALALLDRIQSRDPDLRFEALLERSVREIERDGGGESDDLLQRLAGAATGARLLVAFNRLKGVVGGGEAAALRFMEHAAAAGRMTPNDLRFLRARLALESDEAEEPSATARSEAARELKAIAEDAEATYGDLVNAAALSVRAQEPYLVGRLLTRALRSSGNTDQAAELYLRACRTEEEAARLAAADGMRAEATGEYAAWARNLADALAAGSPSTARRPSTPTPPTGGVPQPQETQLQLRLALADEDWEQAEEFARALQRSWPDLADGAERLGKVLLAARKHDEVLALHAGEDLAPTLRVQRIDALRGLSRPKEAIAEARLLTDQTEASDQALFVLARALRDLEPDAAYGAASAISGRGDPELRLRRDLFRAELLEERGEDDSAAQIYEDLIRMSGGRNIDAWSRLGRLRSKQERDARFVTILTAALQNPPRGMPTRDIGRLFELRAQARGGMGDHIRALEDYRRILSVFPRDPSALNNAAWIIAKEISWLPAELPERLEEALRFSTLAVEEAPTVAAFYQTRAEVLERMQQYDRALADVERALDLLERTLERAEKMGQAEARLLEARRQRGRYQLQKARIHESARDVVAARVVYRAVRDELPGTIEGRQAALALERIGD